MLWGVKGYIFYRVFVLQLNELFQDCERLLLSSDKIHMILIETFFSNPLNDISHYSIDINEQSNKPVYTCLDCNIIDNIEKLTNHHK